MNFSLIDDQMELLLFYQYVRENLSLRLGQAFCNHFSISAEQDHLNLFYETDINKQNEGIAHYIELWQLHKR